MRIKHLYFFGGAVIFLIILINYILFIIAISDLPTFPFFNGPYCGVFCQFNVIDRKFTGKQSNDRSGTQAIRDGCIRINTENFLAGNGIKIISKIVDRFSHGKAHVPAGGY